MNTTPSNTTSDVLAAMLAQYEKNNKPKFVKNENAVEFNEKNYFGTFLGPKESSAIKKIRILPTTDGSSPFVEMDGHKVQVEGKWKTFACLQSENDEPCPFCEARSELLSTGLEKDKILAKEFGTKKMYVVKVIDRENEDDGVKFWRFNHDWRKTGILDKIFAILQLVGDIQDPIKGRDLQISLAKDQNGNPVVQAINSFDPTPLSTNQEQLDLWLNDTKTWRDVYSVKPYTYLEIIVKGGVPVWDKESKAFVDKATLTAAPEGDKIDSELSIGLKNSAAAPPTTTPAPTVPVVNQTSEQDTDVVDDLPF